MLDLGRMVRGICDTVDYYVTLLFKQSAKRTVLGVFVEPCNYFVTIFNSITPKNFVEMFPLGTE